MTAKFASLQIAVDYIKPDVIIECESKINENILTSESGDFNCPSIDWQNLSVRPGGAEPAAQNKLLDIHNKFAISQVHMEPTRGKNNLDLFFTTNLSLLKNSTVVPGISDHDMVVTDCELRPIYNRPKPRKTFQFSKANWDKIKCATKKFRSAFEKTFSQNTVETNWCLFRDFVHSTLH